MKQRIKKNKIYSMLLENNYNLFLSIQYASSLEEAYTLAQEEFKHGVSSVIEHNMADDFGGVKMLLYTTKERNELVETKKEFNTYDNNRSFINPPIKIEEQKSNNVNSKNDDKNKLMKSIIESRNIDEFEKNKDKFNKNEIKYIKEQLEK